MTSKEAIREGAKLHPQTFGWLSRDGGMCALGSGLYTLGFREPADPLEIFDAINHTLNASYPYMIDHRKVFCPNGNILTCHGEDEHWCLRELVLHLNDTHKWTREAIADWLETEEEKLGYETLVESELIHEFVGASSGGR